MGKIRLKYLNNIKYVNKYVIGNRYVPPTYCKLKLNIFRFNVQIRLYIYHDNYSLLKYVNIINVSIRYLELW